MSNHQSTWVNDETAVLFTDLYQLTMVQAYFEENLTETAVFDLFVRRMPKARNYLLFAGLSDVLHYLETLHFSDEAVRYLESLGYFKPAFLDWLSGFKFTGSVRAVAEGTPVFANTPLIEVIAPVAEAQLIETFLLNQITFQTGIASKASRVVRAAKGGLVADFGIRRMHGVDAGMKAARAYKIAGVGATSNVLAGQMLDMKITGTMAHSYIEAHSDENTAFKAFSDVYPNTTLLVDTYDTLSGVQKVIDMAKRQGDSFSVKAIRLDSGDLGQLAIDSRKMLDAAGLNQIQIIVSGGLDEYTIAELLDRGAPIDGFGVGTRMGSLADQPFLDSVYKLVEFAGQGRMKLAKNKGTLPGKKQLFRVMENGTAIKDIVALHDENIEGRSLLVPVMENGERLPAGDVSLDQSAETAVRLINELPADLLSLSSAKSPYLVEVSAKLQASADKVRAGILAGIRQ